MRVTQNTWIHGGLQQIGLGVRNNAEVWKFYREQFGFDIPMFDETGIADIMSPYMGNKKWERHAVFAINIRGGGGVEIWQFTNRNPTEIHQEVHLGSVGILSAYIRCRNIHSLREHLLLLGGEVSEASYAPDGNLRCFVKDTEYNWIGLIETNDGWLIPPRKHQQKKFYVGGVCGALIGVSDMQKSLNFYQNICGYDRVVYDKTDVFSDFDIWLSQQKVRRVLLERSSPNKGIFSHLLTDSRIELVEAKEKKGEHIFKDRYWGDLGFIHLCFDVRGMDVLKDYCQTQGHPFTIDAGNEFAMDDASGRFSYLEDPDGTLIEFVEVYKMPIAKKFGIVINIKKKPFGSILPKFMLKMLKYRAHKK